MQFRPRYSLLTLLLLTAAIALGIKLWRGPHRTSMIDLRAELPKHFQNLTQLASIDPLLYKLLIPGMISGTQELEYEYLRTWSGENQLQAARFKYDPADQFDLLIGRNHADGNEFYVHQLARDSSSWHHEYDGRRALECSANCVAYGITRIERLVCWVANDEANYTTLSPSRATMSELGSYTEAVFPFPTKPGDFSIYFLTAEGNLYQVSRPASKELEKSFCVVKIVTIPEVNRPLRGLLAEELDRLGISR